MNYGNDEYVLGDDKMLNIHGTNDEEAPYDANDNV